MPPVRTRPPFSPASTTNRQTSQHLEEDQEETATCIDIELAEPSPYQSGVHFALCTLPRPRRRALARVYAKNRASSRGGGAKLTSANTVSDRGYYNAHYAAADAIYCFHRLRQHSAVDAIDAVATNSRCRFIRLSKSTSFKLTVSQASGSDSLLRVT